MHAKRTGDTHSHTHTQSKMWHAISLLVSILRIHEAKRSIVASWSLRRLSFLLRLSTSTVASSSRRCRRRCRRRLAIEVPHWSKTKSSRWDLDVANTKSGGCSGARRDWRRGRKRESCSIQYLALTSRPNKNCESPAPGDSRFRAPSVTQAAERKDNDKQFIYLTFAIPRTDRNGLP